MLLAEWEDLWDCAYITNAISDKYRRGRTTLLRGAGNITHPDTDDQTDHRTEKANEGIASYWSGRTMGPCTLPDHGTSCNHRQAAQDQQYDSDVGDPAGEPASQQDKYEDHPSQWKL